MSVSLVQDQSDPKLRRVFFCNLQLICEFKTMCLRIRGIVYSRHLSLCCRSGSEIFLTDPDLNLAYFPHTSSLLPHPSSLIILRTFLSMFSVWTSGSASLVWAACCCCSLDMVEESQEASSHILLIIHAAAQQHPLKPTHIIINTTTFYNDRSVSWIRIRATYLIRIRIRILNTDPDIHNSHN